MTAPLVNTTPDRPTNENSAWNRPDMRYSTAAGQLYDSDNPRESPLRAVLDVDTNEHAAVGPKYSREQMLELFNTTPISMPAELLNSDLIFVHDGGQPPVAYSPLSEAEENCHNSARWNSEPKRELFNRDSRATRFDSDRNALGRPMSRGRGTWLGNSNSDTTRQPQVPIYRPGFRRSENFADTILRESSPTSSDRSATTASVRFESASDAGRSVVTDTWSTSARFGDNASEASRSIVTENWDSLTIDNGLRGRSNSPSNSSHSASPSKLPYGQSPLSASYRPLNGANIHASEEVNDAYRDASRQRANHYHHQYTSGITNETHEMNGFSSGNAQNSAETWTLQEWYYRDPNGNIQGPFLAHQMQSWYNDKYFSLSLPVKAVFRSNFGSTSDTGSFESLNLFIILYSGGDHETPFLSAQPRLPLLSAPPFEVTPPGMGFARGNIDYGGLNGGNIGGIRSDDIGYAGIGNSTPYVHRNGNRTYAGDSNGLVSGDSFSSSYPPNAQDQPVCMAPTWRGAVADVKSAWDSIPTTYGHGINTEVTAGRDASYLASMVDTERFLSSRVPQAVPNNQSKIIDHSHTQQPSPVRSIPQSPVEPKRPTPLLSNIATYHQQGDSTLTSSSQPDNNDSKSTDISHVQAELATLTLSSPSPSTTEAVQPVVVPQKAEPVKENRKAKAKVPTTTTTVVSISLQQKQVDLLVAPAEAPAIVPQRKVKKIAASTTKVEKQSVPQQQSSASTPLPVSSPLSYAASAATAVRQPQSLSLREIQEEEQRQQDNRSVATKAAIEVQLRQDVETIRQQERQELARNNVVNNWAPWVPSDEKNTVSLSDIIQQESLQVSKKQPKAKKTHSPSHATSTSTDPIILKWGTPTSAMTHNAQKQHSVTAQHGVMAPPISTVWKPAANSTSGKSLAEIQREEELHKQKQQGTRDQSQQYQQEQRVQRQMTDSNYMSAVSVKTAYTSATPWADKVSNASKPSIVHKPTANVVAKASPSFASVSAFSGQRGATDTRLIKSISVPTKTLTSVPQVVHAQLKTVPVTNTSATLGKNQQSTNDELVKWAKGALKSLSNSGVNVDEFIKMLMDFKVQQKSVADIIETINSMVLMVSTSIDGRQFAKEFVRRRRACLGIVDQIQESSNSSFQVVKRKKGKI